MNNKKIILASASPRRKELLENLDLEFDIIPDNSDEVIDEFLAPEEVVRALAIQKASNVGKNADKNALVIGADTVVCIDGQILGKPKDAEDAKKMLYTLSGREHYVCTGIAIYDCETGRIVSDMERTAVKFKPLDDDEIDKYVSSGAPLDKAGAYGIQGHASLFVEGIRGDFFNVVGLPVCKLSMLLKNEFGFNIY